MATFQAADANTTTLDASNTSATLELYRAALGPLNTDYYLKAFTRFDAADAAGPSWNWAASLCTLNWMALRKLWGPALAYTGALLAAALLIFGIGRLVFQFSMDVQLGLLAAFGVLALVIPGVFGNALLYEHCRTRVEKALAANPTLEDACAMLKRSAPSRQGLVGLALGNALLIGTGVSAYVAFPDASQLGLSTTNPVQARNAVAGKTLDLATVPVAPASAASAVPAAAASAPSVSVSAPPLVAPALSASALSPVPPPKLAASGTAAPASGIESPQPRTSAPVKAASAPKATNKAPAKAATEQKSKTKQPSAPATAAAKGKVAADADAQKKDTRFLINVGLFADDNNIRNTYTKLSDAGLNVLSNEITGKKGKLTRIRVGPFASQAEADRAAEKIRALKLDAVVVSQ